MAARLLSMVAHFEELEDPRVERTRLHSLVDIICLSICAVIAGAEGWEDIEEFGRQKEAWLRRHRRLENGIPSHDTISRVFRLLKPQAFDAAFRGWVGLLAERLGLSQIAIDGKTLRLAFWSDPFQNAEQVALQPLAERLHLRVISSDRCLPKFALPQIRQRPTADVERLPVVGLQIVVARNL